MAGSSYTLCPPLEFSCSFYQVQNPKELYQRLYAWKQEDGKSIHPIFEAFEQSSRAVFRKRLNGIYRKKELYKYIEEYFLERCAQLYRTDVVPLYGEKKQVASIRAAVSSFIGCRAVMEDTYVWGKLKIAGSFVPYFAICDGHGGVGASLFLKEYLQEILEYVFAKIEPVGLEDSSIELALMMVGVLAEARLSAERSSKASKKVYAYMEQVGARYGLFATEQNKEEFESLCTKMYEASKNAPYVLGGSTLVVALVIDSDLWVANVGDSRAVLVTEAASRQLTSDASLKNEAFQREVAKRGGSVGQDKHGVWRTSGGFGITLARSIGERNEKGVSAQAIVSKYQLSSKTNSLVLGSDGLFDVLSSRDVGAIVQKCSSDSPLRISELLVQAAFASGSEDSITAMVVKL